MASVILPAAEQSIHLLERRPAQQPPATSKQGPPAQNQAAPAWAKEFSPAEAQQLLDADRFAGTAIAIILTAILAVGLALTTAAIWLAR